MTFDEWAETQRINGGPHGFEGVGVERMRHVWDAAIASVRANSGPALVSGDKDAAIRSREAVEALRAELKKPEPVPVAWLCNGYLYIHGAHDMQYIRAEGVPLYRKGDL